MNKVFIIAEAGVNHNGRLDLAYALCDSAKQAGVDAIKFQTWRTENIITKTTGLAKYQEKNILNCGVSQFEMLQKLELSYDSFIKIRNYCKKIGISFLSTPDDQESLIFLVGLGMNCIKVGSGEINNIPYLRQIGATRLPVILSTGMSNLADVECAYNILIEAGVPQVTLLHCTTNYPCPMDEVNLKAMVTLRDAFKCKVGYSDHTLGIEIPIAAVAMGAEIIEKHFTLDKTMDGPDHKASLDPVELEMMVKAIRNIEVALGTGIKKPNQSEKEISKVVLKRIVAKQPIRKGTELNDSNLTVKRCSSGIPASYWDLIHGTKAICDFKTDEPIKISER